MKELSYADNHIVTSDEIADGVIRYARALARANTADTVRMPAIGPDGAVRTVEMLIGPSSQIASVDIDREPVALPEGEVLQELDRRTRVIAAPRARVGDIDDSETFDPDLP